MDDTLSPASIVDDSSASCVRVVGRVRPLRRRAQGVEILAVAGDDLGDDDGRGLRVCSDSDIAIEGSQFALYGARQFRLNRVFDEAASQEDVFESVLPLLSQFVNGYNCTIFMYGQTGSGKTHTMLGYDLWATAGGAESADPSSPVLAADDESSFGILPRAMMHLFNTLDLSVCTMTASYLELYNDIKLYDLLRPIEAEPASLDIRESRKGEIVVPDLAEVRVTSLSEVLSVLWTGARVRKVAATDMNDYSSRSHTVFILRLTRFDPQKRTIISSKMSFVDLAGSEKWRSSQLALMSPERVRELTSINRSLSALGNCVSALLQKNRSHVPYRDSKLTRLLQDSLGGNTLSLFVVTLSPDIENVEETVSTLQFADRAMKVQIIATKNEVVADSSASLKAEIRNLKSLICTLLRDNSSQGQGGGTIDVDELFARAMGNVSKGGDAGTDNSPAKNAMSMEEDYTKLMEQFRCCQEQLQIALDENRSLLTILESNYRSVSSLEHPSNDGSDPPPPPTEAPVGSPVAIAVEMSPELRLQLLAARASELERRERVLVQVEAAQEERWALLTDYHTWLQSQARFLESDAIAADAAGVPVSDVYRRVQLMEGSVLVQADELRRAKALFIKTNTDLQRRLSQLTRENIELRRSQLGNLQCGGDSMADPPSDDGADADAPPETPSDYCIAPSVSSYKDSIESPISSSRPGAIVEPKRVVIKTANPPPLPPYSPPPLNNSSAKTTVKPPVPAVGQRSYDKKDGSSSRLPSDTSKRQQQQHMAGSRGVSKAVGSDKTTRNERSTAKSESSGAPGHRSGPSARAPPLTPRKTQVSKAPASASPIKIPAKADSEHGDDGSSSSDALVRAALAQAEEIFKRHAPVLQHQAPATSAFVEEISNFEWTGNDATKVGEEDMEYAVAATAQKASKPKAKKVKRLWEAYVDASSGESYYFNRSTRVTTWDRPPEEELELLWNPASSTVL